MHKNNGTSFECRCVRKHTCIVKRRVTWMCKHLGVYDFDYLKNRYWVSGSHSDAFWKWWEETDKTRLSFDSKKQRSSGDISSFLLTRKNPRQQCIKFCLDKGIERWESPGCCFLMWGQEEMDKPHTIWPDQESKEQRKQRYNERKWS